jgi:hypothetical protein
MLALFALASAIVDDLWLFVLLATWGSHQKGAFVGGVGLFMPMLRHTEVTLILGLLSLYFVFRKRYMAFWLVLSASVFIHSLVTLHLSLMIIPVLFLKRRASIGKWNALGVCLYVMSLIFWTFDKMRNCGIY